MSTDSEPKQDERGKRDGLHNGQRRLHPLSFLDSAQVDPGEHPDGDERDEALRGETKLNRRSRGCEIHLREPRVPIGTDRRPQDTEESAECDGDGGDSSGLDYNEESPAIKKAHEVTHGLS